MNKSSREMSFEATKMVLEKSSRAMRPFEIWQEIKANNFFNFTENLGFSGKTPMQSYYAAIYTDLKEPKSPFEIMEQKPLTIKLKSQNFEKNNNIKEVTQKVEKSNYNERNLHALLSFFVANSSDFDAKIYTKTIFHEKSPKNLKGTDKWLHPDIVGVSFLSSNFKSELINFSKKFEALPLKIYSFEMKKELTLSNLKECYFQAVSNSSWAHEGYLVALDISEDELLRSAIKRLNSSFNIGVISLNSVDPAQSEIIARAIEKNQIDMIGANELCDNPDFNNFLSSVCDCEPDKMNRYELEFDRILDDEEIKEYIKEKKIGL